MPMTCAVYTFGKYRMCRGCGRDGRMPYRVEMDGYVVHNEDNVEALAMPASEHENDA